MLGLARRPITYLLEILFLSGEQCIFFRIGLIGHDFTWVKIERQQQIENTTHQYSYFTREKEQF